MENAKVMTQQEHEQYHRQTLNPDALEDLYEALNEIDRHIYVSGTNDTAVQRIMSEYGIKALRKAEVK